MGHRIARDIERPEILSHERAKNLQTYMVVRHLSQTFGLSKTQQSIATFSYSKMIHTSLYTQKSHNISGMIPNTPAAHISKFLQNNK